MYHNPPVHNKHKPIIMKSACEQQNDDIIRHNPASIHAIILIIMPFVMTFQILPLVKKEYVLIMPEIGNSTMKSNNNRYVIIGVLAINVRKCVKSQRIPIDIISDRTVPNIKKALIVFLAFTIR